MGTHNTIYISLPDTDPQCGSYYGQLTATSTGWNYHCSTSANYTKINGTGWIPVDLTSVQFSAGTLFASLPKDPINTVANGYYYTYIPGSWALSATMESEKYIASNAANDGGQVSTRFEVGNEIVLNENLLYAIPTNGLVGYWKFKDNILDETSNHNDGSWNGTGTHYGVGKVGVYAGQFNGVDDYVDVGNGNSLKIAGDITVMAWIKPGAGSNSVRNAYVAKIYNATPWYGYEIAEANANNDNFGCRYGTSSSPLEFAGSTIIQEGSWYHVACIITSLEASLYVNGSLDGTGAGRLITDSNQSLKIGNDFPGSLYAKGLIDEVAVYNRALSIDEILAIYNGQK